ncbi:MAG: hypothetical protein HY695_07740 [Deltaproteobacteria bacterium]|nr:hypothetical protein [Deltaproteobacteria bacterium]
MVHILAPKPAEPTLPVFFNLDGVVGAPPAENRLEDVLFVQFCFRFAADHPGPSMRPETLAAFRAVQANGVCDAATINAIRLTQERIKRHSPGTVVDGRVSPARGYSFGGALWTIVHYNNVLQEQTRTEWPRIDKLSGCPPALVQAVIRELVGD